MCLATVAQTFVADSMSGFIEENLLVKARVCDSVSKGIISIIVNQSLNELPIHLCIFVVSFFRSLKNTRVFFVCKTPLELTLLLYFELEVCILFNY